MPSKHYTQCNFIKKDSLAQVFSCQFYDTFKNTFFTEHLWVTASVNFTVKELCLPIFHLLTPSEIRFPIRFYTWS